MILTSKYAGTCRVCRRPYGVGARISWTKGVQGADHAECSPEGKATAQAVAQSRAVDADVSVPAPEGMSYFPFQRAGVAFAVNALGAGRAGVLIADEMGLGKTVQAIGVVNADPTIRQVLVISPKSLTLNWVRELARWLVRDLHVTRHPTTQADDVVVVVSYEEAKKAEKLLAARAWDLVVVDEAHLIKNGKAQRTKTVHALARQAKRRVLLTGTPIANRPVELFSLLQVVDPQTWDPAGRKRVDGKLVDMPAGSGCGFFKFAKRYCGAVQGRWGWDFSGATNLPELQERLRSTCMVRRLKADVLTDLPAKRRQVVELDAGEFAEEVERERDAWARHEEAVEAARAAVELAQADGDEAYDAAVKKLKDATEVAFTEISRLRHDTAVAKVNQVVEHVRAALEDDDGKKIVVMAHHHDVMDGIESGLAEFGAVKLTGQTALEDRQAAVDRFQNDPTCRVFVGSIIAAGVGITLTASSHVVFAELDWVPGNVSQAEDRCHRIGQTDSVLVQHLVFDGSLDARMAHVLVEKQRVADASLDKVAPSIPAVPGERAATEGKRAELDEVAAKLSDAVVEEVHQKLRLLAGMCDGASSWDGAGFSKIDVRIGHDLAARPRLTKRQAALGLRLVRKYRRQVGDVASV